MDNLSNRFRSLSIMYVEDDSVTRELVAITLPKKFPACTVCTAENGKAGIELYKQYRPDIVITDINMPVMNGILMAGEIKKLNPEVVIIAVTAYSETNYLLNAIEIGISHYVLKPIDYSKLFEAIEKSCAVISLRKQLAEQNKLIRELNECLEKHTVELVAANRELESFSYTVSHDLRTPLTNIRGYGQLLLENTPARLEERDRNYVHNILMETERMDHLIGSLLQFSKLTHCPLNRKPVNLSDLSRSIAADLRCRKREGSVEFRIAENVVVQGDEQLLRVVMENLLGNAWKYTGKNPDAVIEFGAAQNSDSIVCFVRDNGIGFDMANVELLFQSFQRLHNDKDFSGHGIGLATVHRIIQHHGGWIEAAGEPGKGAVFTFTV